MFEIQKQNKLFLFTNYLAEKLSSFFFLFLSSMCWKPRGAFHKLSGFEIYTSPENNKNKNFKCFMHVY